MKRKIRTKPRGSSPAKLRTAAKRTKRSPAAARQSGAPTIAGDDIEALAAAGAQALGIPLDPSWQASVTFNLRLILSHAAKIDGFPLPDDTEPAAIFHA
jgi:hypothetical protein